jgi:hypothetical protein
MRVSLDFDILIEYFISLCIIETVGAIIILIVLAEAALR